MRRRIGAIRWFCTSTILLVIATGTHGQDAMDKFAALNKAELALDQANSPRFRRGTKLKKTRNPLAFCGV